MLRTFIRRFRTNGRPSMRQLATIVGELSWQKVDALYDQCRLKLREEPRWRYGPGRIQTVSQEWLDILRQHGGIAGKTYLDLGCGSHHPFGVSTVMYLNGAAGAYAVDIQPTEAPRAARALFDLLSDCLCFPERWCAEAEQREEFAARIRHYDLQALSEGDLVRGTAGVPIQYFVDDIKQVAVPAGSIDLFASRAVLEHFLDLPEACRVLHRMCSAGAVGVHHIDMRDHRAYASPDFHYWSFLTKHGTRPTANGTRSETYPRTDADLTNRLRWHEVRQTFEEAGFEFLHVDLRSETPPAGLRAELVPPFDELSEDELPVTGATFVVRRR